MTHTDIRTADPRFDDVLRQVMEELDEGMTATGAQVHLAVHGEVVLDAALGTDGRGRPVDPSTVFQVSCASKPLLALALAVLYDEGEVSLHDVLGNLIEEPIAPGLMPLTVESLLTHTAGLHQLLAFEALLHPPEVRRKMILETPPTPGWVPGRMAAYSEVSAWELLSVAVTDLCGDDYRSFIDDRVIGPYGLEDEIFLARNPIDDDRLGVNVYMDHTTPIPMLAELRDRFRRHVPAAFGVYTSARGLATFYEGLRLELAGAGRGVVDPSTLELFTTDRRGVLDDLCMRRACGWGLGFMAGLRRHAFGGRVSERGFGHSGHAGAVFAFCDPEIGLSAAVVFNGQIDPDTAVGLRRPALCAAIYRGLEMAGADAAL